MSRYKSKDRIDKQDGKPHADWMLNDSYFKRFDWPEHEMKYHEGVTMYTVFPFKEEKNLTWPGGKSTVELNMTYHVDFHVSHEEFKKLCNVLASKFRISIQDPKKHVLFARG